MAAGLFDGLGNGNALFFIVIGSNVGTCITALISSIGANANARRAADHITFIAHSIEQNKLKKKKNSK